MYVCLCACVRACVCVCVCVNKILTKRKFLSIRHKSSISMSSVRSKYNHLCSSCVQVTEAMKSDLRMGPITRFA